MWHFSYIILVAFGFAASAQAQSVEMEAANEARPTSLTRYTVQSGESLDEIAVRFGITLEALMTANNLTRLTVNPGTVLQLPEAPPPETYTVKPDDTLYDIALLVGVTVDQLVALNDLEGKLIQAGQVLTVSGTPAETPSRPLVVVAEQGDTLWDIARTHDLTVVALREANDLTAQTLQPGDTLKIPGHFSPDMHDLGAATAQEVAVREGDTLAHLAARYDTSVSALISANNLQSDRIQVGQRLRVIPADELAPAGRVSPLSGAAESLRWPLQGVVTSYFGYRELRVNGSNFHNALDIDGVTGDPVRAAAPGTVTFSGWRGDYGNLIVVRSGATEYRYAHNSALLVQEGEQVNAGDVLALVGNTGLSFGDHLHFEVRSNGSPIDPLPLLSN